LFSSARQALAEALKINRTVARLDLQRNHIQVNGAKAGKYETWMFLI